MSLDLELKRQDINNDFNKCLARLDNIKIILNNKSLDDLNNYQKEEILVDLGRVGELAFKYLLKLKQLELYPNQSYEQFAKSQPIFKKSAIQDLKNKNLITEEDLEEIKNFTDENSQPFHNYSYLSLILEKLLPNIHANLKKYIEYKEQSKEIIKELDFNEEWDKHYITHVIFPELIWTGRLEIPIEKINKIMTRMSEVEKNTGDIFTRLRYFYNNQSLKEFNIKEIYLYIESLGEFIKGIHENDDILDTNPSMIFGKLESKKHIKFLKRSEEEIDLIFKECINEDPIDIDSILLAPSYSFQEIKNIRNFCKENDLLYFQALENNLTLEEIQYFIKYNIYDFLIMSQILYKENHQKRSFDEIENTLKEIEYEKFDNACLLGFFTKEEILELNKHENIEKFLIEHCYDALPEMLDIDKLPYSLAELLKIKELTENPDALFSLDYNQVKVYSKFINYLNSNDKYHHLFSQKPINILENIKINLETYGEIKELLYSIPLMLDPEEINEILMLLIVSGLDITKLDNFNSTILCMPSNFVYALHNILTEKNILLIKNNNVCDEFFEYSNQLLKTLHKNIKTSFDYYEPFRGRISDSKELFQQKIDKLKNKK